MKFPLAIAGLAAGTLGAGIAYQQQVVDRLRRSTDPHRHHDFDDLPILQRGGSERHVVSADGTRIRIVEFGPEDGEFVILMHGFVSTGAVWNLVIGGLTAAGRRVIVPEQRGHGGSTLGTSGYDLNALGHDLAAVIETLPNDRRLTVVGHSMGSVSMFSMALQRPDVTVRIDRNVIVSGLHKGRGKPPFMELKKHILQTRWYNWARSNHTQGIFFTRNALGPNAPYSLVSATHRMYLSASGAMIEHMGRALLTFDFRDALPHMKAPSFLLVGSADNKTPPALARSIAGGLPDAQLVELPHIGHMTPLEVPDIIIDMILAA
ncbi:MAG: pimeloyl-ACP methyl ester carboxylesterase [Candidatus Poriferisodalaceae bacterium]